MEFYKMAWEFKWFTLEQLKFLTLTEKQPWGKITPEEFKEITGQEYKE